MTEPRGAQSSDARRCRFSFFGFVARRPPSSCFPHRMDRSRYLERRHLESASGNRCCSVNKTSSQTSSCHACHRLLLSVDLLLLHRDLSASRRSRPTILQQLLARRSDDQGSASFVCFGAGYLRRLFRRPALAYRQSELGACLR